MSKSYTITLNDAVCKRLGDIIGVVNPLAKAGDKISVDFSQKVMEIGDYESPAEISTNLGVVAATADTYFVNFSGGQGPIAIQLQKNEAGDQLVANIIAGDYVSASNQIVIYEGDVSAMTDTTDILASLPTVEFTVPEITDPLMYWSSDDSSLVDVTLIRA